MQDGHFAGIEILGNGRPKVDPVEKDTVFGRRAATKGKTCCRLYSLKAKSESASPMLSPQMIFLGCYVESTRQSPVHNGGLLFSEQEGGILMLNRSTVVSSSCAQPTTIIISAASSCSCGKAHNPALRSWFRWRFVVRNGTKKLHRSSKMSIC